MADHQLQDRKSIKHLSRQQAATLCMYPMRVAAASGPVGSGLACSLIDAVGRHDFGPRLLRLLSGSLRADMISSVAFGNRSPVLLGHDSLTERTAEERTVRGYFSGCYRDDPNEKALSHDMKPGDTVIAYMNRADAPTSSYRRLWSEEGHIVDRLSMLHKTGWGDGITLSFYRCEPNSPFGPKEFDRIAELAPLLNAVCMRHYEFMAARLPPNFDQALLRLTERFPLLTRREAQCAAGVVSGLTANDIALKLGIKAASVITHRKHAYERLGVAGQRELAALYHETA